MTTESLTIHLFPRLYELQENDAFSFWLSQEIHIHFPKFYSATYHQKKSSGLNEASGALKAVEHQPYYALETDIKEPDCSTF